MGSTISRSEEETDGKYNSGQIDTKSTSQYHRTNVREVKIAKFDGNKKLKQEIDFAILKRSSNRLHNDHQREILSKGYKFKKIIGSGSYAHVFLAKDLKVNRDVAIKLIELGKCSAYYQNTCLRNEIYVIRRLSNENIVRFYEAFNTSVAYVMVMEFVDNGTFADYLRKNGAVSEVKARKLFIGVFNGVEYMHQQWIAHRDLKLENLLLNKNMEPKIVDFSLSVIWDGKRLLTDWCGTPLYFAPEILQMKPYNPLCYDIWSLGVCLYIMLNDCIPFYSEDDKEMLRKQLNCDWKFRSRYEGRISGQLKQMIRGMLEPDVQMRLKINDLIQKSKFKVTK